MPVPFIPIAAIEQIAGAIKEGFKVLGQILSGAELRKARYRIEAAMHYVHVDRKEGEYKDIPDDKQKALKIHFGKRVFDE